jgi:hypothetical protein
VRHLLVVVFILIIFRLLLAFRILFQFGRVLLFETKPVPDFAHVPKLDLCLQAHAQTQQCARMCFKMCNLIVATRCFLCLAVET